MNTETKEVNTEVKDPYQEYLQMMEIVKLRVTAIRQNDSWSQWNEFRLYTQLEKFLTEKMGL